MFFKLIINKCVFIILIIYITIPSFSFFILPSNLKRSKTNEK